MEVSTVAKKRGRDEPDSAVLGEFDSPEVKRLRENLLDGLDDEDKFFEAGQDLDSFMKSFEDEIAATPTAGGGVDAAEVVGLGLPCDESRPDLGYLLEASDDELGIPPPTSSAFGLGSELRTELERVESESTELSEFWEFPSYDPFGFGDAALSGLFDYSDVGFGSGDFAYRPETLPAQ